MHTAEDAGITAYPGLPSSDSILEPNASAETVSGEVLDNTKMLSVNVI